MGQTLEHLIEPWPLSNQKNWSFGQVEFIAREFGKLFVRSLLLPEELVIEAYHGESFAAPEISRRAEMQHSIH